MSLESALHAFSTQPLLAAARGLFKDTLKIPLSPLADAAITPQRFFRNNLKDAHAIIQSIYLVGRVEDRTFTKQLPPDDFETLESSIKIDYEGLFILAVDLGENYVTRSELSSFTRDFNRAFKAAPVIVVYKYDHDQTCISLASCERSGYQQQWRDGEKPGKVSLLKDILPEQPHSAHLRFLLQLTVPERGNTCPTNFRDLHRYWQRVFDNRVLNEQFYREVAAWYQHAIGRIRLPDCPAHFRDNSEAHVKDFTVRLICRLMFCWFLKERGLIPAELLELRDYRGRVYPLVKDSNEADLNLEMFGQSSSYYRAVLQNLFFNALHQPIATRKRKTTEWYRSEELHPDFDHSLFDRVPYINAALFEKDDGDNVSNRSDEGVFSVPNELFYAEEIAVQRGAGARNRVVTKGLNRIFAQYKFTIEENTSLEEEVALDPELLGMVFENLLAEIDPNDDGSADSARKESGSYYTPRRIIDYMVNDALLIHLRNAMGYREGTLPTGYEQKLENLLYFDQIESEDADFRKAVIEALDRVKILDPACGSGAFPVGMLNRMVQLLKLVDPDNHLWIELQVQRLPDELQEQTRRDLLSHDNNYPRKLGLIRNAIYGIDIQPMAVMITKLRFFISLLIDQKIDPKNPATNYGMEQLPNMETKVICANSLQNFTADLLHDSAIADLARARKRYYQRDLSAAERAAELEIIITKLDEAFPQFYKASLGHPGLSDEAGRRRANRKCLETWFHFGSMAAPFFSLKFFFPEVAQIGGFDIVIGNPPYGGTPIPDPLKTSLNLGSKDPYGAFISRFIAHDPPLKRHGVLAYIVSDTFMTIKSHKPLREQILLSFIHRMIRVHKDTFNATVNTAIIILEREIAPTETSRKSLIPDVHTCLMADLTQVSIHESYSRFLQLLYRTSTASEIGKTAESGTNIMRGDTWSSESSPEYALYCYPQNLIRSNSNFPLFVASPKLFSLAVDVGNHIIKNERHRPSISYKIYINGKKLNLYKLGDKYTGSGRTKKWQNVGLFQILSGIKTGNNAPYLRILSKDAQKNFELLSESEVIPDNEAEQLEEEEKLNGITKGRHYVRFEMGMPSDADNGLLPCYNQSPSLIAIDWSEAGVNGMRNEARSDLANADYRFRPLCSQISFSFAGEYSPTFRTANAPVFLNAAPRIFLKETFNLSTWLGYLNSKLFRFIARSMVNHSVNFGVDDIKEVLVIDNLEGVATLVDAIRRNQQFNPNYDYASNEQIEIDRLVYEAYGLNEDDIQEVENWYARRYPALAAAQRANLERKLAGETGGKTA